MMRQPVAVTTHLSPAAGGGDIVIWALVVAVSVLVVVCSFVLSLLLRARRYRRRTPDAFRCRVTAPSLRLPRRSHWWRDRACWATWAHDVLVVQDGPLAGPLVLRVRFPEGPVVPA